MTDMVVGSLGIRNTKEKVKSPLAAKPKKGKKKEKTKGKDTKKVKRGKKKGR